MRPYSPGKGSANRQATAVLKARAAQITARTASAAMMITPLATVPSSTWLLKIDTCCVHGVGKRIDVRDITQPGWRQAERQQHT